MIERCGWTAACSSVSCAFAHELLDQAVVGGQLARARRRAGGRRASRRRGRRATPLPSGTTAVSVVPMPVSSSSSAAFVVDRVVGVDDRVADPGARRRPRRAGPRARSRWRPHRRGGRPCRRRPRTAGAGGRRRSRPRCRTATRPLGVGGRTQPARELHRVISATVLPNWTWSPLRSRVTSAIRSPLTYVPLVDPRSST